MLEVQRLHCGYGAQEIVREVSFSLKPAEILGIIGPNGSGKTTLLRALSGRLPSRGLITWNGCSALDSRRHERSRMLAVVSQDHEMNADLTVFECVALGRIPHQPRLQFFESPRDEEVIGAALTAAGIGRLKDRRLSTLSGGECQLVYVAQALAQEPKILFLDEPVVFLDIFHQARILELIDRLRQQHGMAVLIVLHELNLASEYCDRLLLLQNGSVRASGTPASVLTPQTIAAAYGVPVYVSPNPCSGRPQVVIQRTGIAGR